MAAREKCDERMMSGIRRSGFGGIGLMHSSIPRFNRGLKHRCYQQHRGPPLQKTQGWGTLVFVMGKEKQSVEGGPPARFFILVAVLSLALVQFANAQKPTDCKNPAVVMSVIDKDGNAVAGLKPSDFRASVHGHAIRVIDSVVTHPAVRVVILVDLSASTLQTLKAERSLAGNLVATEGRKIRPALVLFSDHIIDSLDFSHTPEEILRRLENLPESKGRTALLDALEYAASLFGHPVAGDSIYIISDGGDNVSKAGVYEVKQDFLAKEIRIYSVAWGHAYFPTEEEARGPEMLNGLADSTGGKALQVNAESREDQEQLAPRVKQLYEQITGFYNLQLEGPLPPKSRLKLEVFDTKGAKRKGVHVLHPHELTHCATENAALSH